MNTINVKEFSEEDEFNWSELAILHASDEFLETFDYTSEEFGFTLIEDFDIKQNKKIVVLHRYIRKPILSNFETLLQSDDTKPETRITYWAVKATEDNYVIVYDFSSNRVNDGDFSGL